MALVLAVAACGGGGGGGDAGLPIDMTLTATTVDPRSIDVRWTAPPSLPTRYDLYANGAYLESSIGFTFALVTGLTPETRQCFVVYAVYWVAGAVSRSNEVCVTTPADLPPSTPTGVSAASVTPARIDLAWLAASDDWGIAGYRITRNGVVLATPNAIGYSDLSADPGTTYCSTVAALDAGGNLSPPSARVCATTPADTQAPSPPTALSATASDTTVTLTWTAASDNGAVAAYRIVRDGGLVQTLPAPAGTTQLQATDPNLTAYTQYCYEVIAVDRANNASGLSNRACTTTSWQRSVIFAAPTVFDYVGERQSLMLDGAGTLHIAYSVQSWDPIARTYGPAALHYANNAAGAWIQTQIAAAFSPLHRPAIAVDGSARPQVAFVDAINGFPQYAQPFGAWQIETIAMESASGVSLALDGSAAPRVAYGRTAALRYASRASGAWSIADVPGVASSREPVLALDSVGHAHVAFVDATSQSLRYATDAGGSWSITTVEPVNTGGWHFVAVAVDAAAGVHLSYYDGTARQLKYATNRSGSWVTTVVDGAGDVGVRTSIAVDAAGAVQVSYIDFAQRRLKYASDALGSWRTYDLDSAGYGPNGSSGDTSLAVERGGRVHILYFAESGLRYATRP